MEGQMIKVKFEGIDSWSRPIFKDVDSSMRFGSVDKLFGGDIKKEEILQLITESDLTYFGNRFDCEPMGDPVDNIEIVEEGKICQKEE
jgi:hypothetical protein